MLNELPLPSKVSSDTPLGAHFTPREYAKWVIEEFQLTDKWRAGASFFDPTAGDGIFLSTLIELTEAAGHPVSKAMMDSLFASEIHPPFFERLVRNVSGKTQHSINLDNFREMDFAIENFSSKVDIIIGNPPWKNFSEIPDDFYGRTNYREVLKKKFRYYGIVQPRQQLLLGNSRVDIATLIASKAIYENLNANGKAYFFLPLSLLFNSGAHAQFLSCSIREKKFAFSALYDFHQERAFPAVRTRYGLLEIAADQTCTFPVRAKIHTGLHWEERSLDRAFSDDGPLVLVKPGKNLHDATRLKIQAESRPRQGVNTGGANPVLHFVHLENEFRSLAGEVYNGDPALLKPLLPTGSVQREIPHRYVLLPYRNDGSLMDWGELQEKGANIYFEKIKESLIKRKGIYIRAKIESGKWWAMLGVGSYSFASYKVYWPAYGSAAFSPLLLTPEDNSFGIWQGNQALHASMSFSSGEKAEEVLSYLKQPFIEDFFASSSITRSRSFAQPGRVSRLFDIQS